MPYVSGINDCLGQQRAAPSLWSFVPCSIQTLTVLTAPTSSPSFSFKHSDRLRVSDCLCPLSCILSFLTVGTYMRRTLTSPNPNLPDTQPQLFSRLLLLLAVPGLAESHRYGQTGGGYCSLRTMPVIVPASLCSASGYGR